MALPNSRDFGHQARYLYKVFDDVPEEEHLTRDDASLDWSEEILDSTPKGRKQVRLEIAREAGRVREILIERVSGDPDDPKVETVLRLNRDKSARFLEIMQALPSIPVEGESKVRIDDQTIRDVFSDPDAVKQLYSRRPDAIRQAVEDDPDASDLIAIAHRKQIVEKFRRLLEEPQYFQEEKNRLSCGDEKVWQTFLEQNPWILGVGLTGQLLTSWSDEKLEQVVAGFSVASRMKRTDAFMRTSGGISALVFAEIKHNKTDLLDGEYRPDCW